MPDLLYVAIIVAFFAVCTGFVRVCDRLIGGTGVTVVDSTSPGVFSGKDQEGDAA